MKNLGGAIKETYFATFLAVIVVCKNYICIWNASKVLLAKIKIGIILLWKLASTVEGPVSLHCKVKLCRLM